MYIGDHGGGKGCSAGAAGGTGSAGAPGAVGTVAEEGWKLAAKVCEEEGFKMTGINEAIKKLQVKALNP